MDFVKLLQELRAERDQLDKAIASLEKLDGDLPGVPEMRSRRGRRDMSAAERQAVSERMKRYWAKRKEGESGEE